MWQGTLCLLSPSFTKSSTSVGYNRSKKNGDDGGSSVPPHVGVGSSEILTYGLITTIV